MVRRRLTPDDMDIDRPNEGPRNIEQGPNTEGTITDPNIQGPQPESATFGARSTFP